MRTLKNFIHLLIAFLASMYYGFPSKRLKVIGVTGTDGKTTTTHLIFHILKEAGVKVSMISTIYAKIGETTYETGLHTTTPNSPLIQNLLAQTVKSGDTHFVLEVTSHAIDQNRVAGITYETGVITNVTHEHLDYHKTYENYLRTKAELLLRSNKALINRDDDSYQLLSQFLQKNGKKFFTFGLQNKADYEADIAKMIKADLPEFNSYNYLTAYAVTKMMGIDEKTILKALSSFSPPKGRLEIVYDKDFTVMVDFAHTPHAFESLLSSLKKQYKDGRMIHVFGSAAERDVSKRPFMGIQSGTYADTVIVTEEDYRTEDPMKICRMIAEGLEKEGFSEVEKGELKKGEKQYALIIDREEAIRAALSLAKKGDLVVITGKGHETSICRGTTEYPWSDQECVRKLTGTV
jgi:UDP-N-acetylmuramoyl-L-alanyl-D-glutamate--2,6-diaminopimelate ligase